MRREMDKIVFESRSEISALQDLLENACNSKPIPGDDEKQLAKELIGLLEVMWYTW
jgi:hypothetical protein